jgi:RNA polymerase sporulation-specific sigma factor
MKNFPVSQTPLVEILTEQGADELQGKVEICGVNTARLPVMKNARTLELIAKAHAGDENARDELVSGNLRLVLSVIQKFANRGESMDDLFQVGCIGLIKAIDAFDLNQGVQFSTYGVPMIAGELRRFLRDHGAVRVSRSMRDTAYRVMQAREKLTAETGREPDAEAIAKELGIKREDVVFAMDAVSDPVSLYDPVYSDAGESMCVMDQIGDTRDTDEQWLEKLALGEAMSKLTEREKRILALRFGEGRTQMEVASDIGISQAQVSRLEKNAVSQIKKSLFVS